MAQTSNRRNHYRVLHVQPEAPLEVIKASYRAMMMRMKIHPDLGGDHDIAAVVNEAYAVLSDPHRSPRMSCTHGSARSPRPKAAPA